MDGSYGNAPVTPPEKSPTEKPSVDKENEMGETALISNKILSPDGEPLKEGDEIVVQIVKNYGDESEVKYAPHKPGEEKGEPSTESSPEADFAVMDQKGMQ
jgi:hypothetical protein